MQKNIFLAYILGFCRYSWFWMGTWIFYYLRLTNYAGVGLVESYQILAITISNVPAGVIADMFGKKNTLSIAFLLLCVGVGGISISTNVFWLSISCIIAGTGGSFFNGTLDAFMYDTLKEAKNEHVFDKVIAKSTSISLIAPAICGIIGGYLYTIRPNIPFVIQSIFLFFGFIITFFLVEPKGEKLGTSFSTFGYHMQQGFSQLWTTPTIKRQTILLVGIGLVSTICFEMLNDFLGVEFTFTPTQLSITWAVLFIFSAFVAHIPALIKTKIPYSVQTFLIGFIIAISLIFSPLGGLFVGVVTMFFRSSAQAMFTTTSSVMINSHVDSKLRTTTLSVFSLLKDTPYVLSAFYLGYLADHFTALRIAFFLGLGLLVFLVTQIFVHKPNAQL